MKALDFLWKPGMLFRKAFETKDAGGIKWFEGRVTSVYHNDPWYNLKVQWKHSDRNENFVSPWTVEPLNPPISLPRQPPATPQGPSGPQGSPDSQNSGPGNVTGVEFFPKQHILTSKFREEQQGQAECQREYDGPESALLIIDDTQQDQDGSFEVLPVKFSRPSKVTSTWGAYKKIDSRSLCFAGHAEDVCEAVSGIVVRKHLSLEIGSTVPSWDAVGELSVFQLIQAYQEKAARLPPIEEIRTVLDHSLRGVLSTLSHKHEGYPSGLMVDFVCDAYGCPILAISSLEVHTKDILSNPKCSLLVAKDPKDRTDLVITVHGDAISVSEKDIETIRTAYLARHPGAFWDDFGDFQFIRIEPKVVRYVSGVATASLGSGEFSKEEYRMAKVDPIFQFSKPVAVDSAHMLDLDSLGFNVKAGYQGSTFKLRIPFPRRATDRKDVKTFIVEMLQAATPQVD
ncbi:uncharacterized protein LOC132313110 isoform X2 [Cornus florida]|uniref:uncharacterized protein LOC132313110 isoform X2 n=1 Tax=Cornus florida TaxID=4283 RepID=UPI0028A0D7B8|nr:uncharacterized protein LOC132313110 isoform X2 [Cornus florida]